MPIFNMMNECSQGLKWAFCCIFYNIIIRIFKENVCGFCIVFDICSIVLNYGTDFISDLIFWSSL